MLLTWTPPPPPRPAAQAKGRKRYILTMTWRMANKLPTILDRPHPLMRFIKAHTNHFFYGRTRAGHCVYYETPKAAKLDVFAKAGVTIDELLYHFVYISEYLYQRMDTQENARCLSVVDCTGISLGDMRGDVVDYLKKVAQITQTHYPERSAGIMIINAPFSFRFVWAIVKNFMDPVTLKKTHLFGSSFKTEVDKLIDLSQFPEEFGGTTKFVPTITPLGPALPATALAPPLSTTPAMPKSKEEEDMFALADKCNVDFCRSQPTAPLPRDTLVGVSAAEERKHE